MHTHTYTNISSHKHKHANTHTLNSRRVRQNVDHANVVTVYLTRNITKKREKRSAVFILIIVGKVMKCRRRRNRNNDKVRNTIRVFVYTWTS